MSVMNYKEIYKKYTPLVIRMVKKYPAYLWEDLKQEAYIALYEAYKVWDSNRSSFMTLAYKYIGLACYKYIRDKASMIRVSAKPFREGVSRPCTSLDLHLSDKATLEDLFGSESKEEEIDASITVWRMLKKLADKHIITWKSFAFIYYRYFQECPYSVIGSYFGTTGKNVSTNISRTLMKIRPYFLGRKRI